MAKKHTWKLWLRLNLLTKDVENGEAAQVTDPLTQNDPKKIICRVPSLAAGEYTLKIVTRYSNGTTLLKEPRAIVYDLPLLVS
jgi:hypothetical protein